MRVKLFNTCTGRSTSSNERLSCLHRRNQSCLLRSCVRLTSSFILPQEPRDSNHGGCHELRGSYRDDAWISGRESGSDIA